ncbi:hypothetical protein RM11_0150 [Bartonella quintana RM-11]|nr:hypothetical protein RM11_0150 [Bartonella quintana RM-11]
MKLDNTMMKSIDAVMDLLTPLRERARAKAASEQVELQNFAKSQGSNESLKAWDWRYYAERLRAENFFRRSR